MLTQITKLPSGLLITVLGPGLAQKVLSSLTIVRGDAHPHAPARARKIFHFINNWVRDSIAARVRYGLTRSTSGIGLSGAAVVISRLKRSVVPSNIHPPSLQREPVSIDFPSRTRSAFAVASRSAR